MNDYETIQSTKGQFKNSTELSLKLENDFEFRKIIERLSNLYLGRKISGCSNCYFDAYMELIHYSKTKAMEKNKCLFALRAGAVLEDIDGKKTTTNVNLTNDLAIYHLRKTPSHKKYFTKLPDNLDELLNPIKKPKKE